MRLYREPGHVGGLGEFGLLNFLAPVVSASITAGGALGSAGITADATKYAANQEKQGALFTAITNAKALLANAEATRDAATIKAQGQVTSSLGTDAAILGAVLLAAWWFK